MAFKLMKNQKKKIEEAKKKRKRIRERRYWSPIKERKVRKERKKWHSNLWKRRKEH